MAAVSGPGQIGLRGFGERFEPGLILKTVRQPVGRYPVLGLDHPPDLAAIGAQLRRERGGRPHNRTQ